MPQYLNAIRTAFAESINRWNQQKDNWFNVDLVTALGTIQVAAEIIIDTKAKQIGLVDIAVYAEGKSYPVGKSSKEIREALTDLRTILRANGYSGSITGRRANNSSSAQPGHDVTVQL